MIKAIVYGYNREECESLYQDYCHNKGIPCRMNDFISLTYRMSLSERQTKIKGTWSGVMKGDIALIGFGNGTKEARQDYAWLYNANLGA